jgi:hypothetical protein
MSRNEVDFESASSQVRWFERLDSQSEVEWRGLYVCIWQLAEAARQGRATRQGLEAQGDTEDSNRD